MESRNPSPVYHWAFSFFVILLPLTANIQVVGHRSNSVQLEHDASYQVYLRQFDQTVARYMRERRIPGASIAISKHDQFLLRKGYGRASASRLVTPWSLFRVGSISKVVTAAGVLKLYEDGRLSLDDKVFGTEGILTQYNISGEGMDERLADITVQQLLQHTVGWDQEDIGDPLLYRGIGESLGLTGPAHQHHIIAFMLKRPLRYSPGAAYSYSNFGYMVLGRVIEEVTGQPYDVYTKYMLWASGIYSFKLGHTRKKDADPSEVEYYSTYPANRVKSVFPQQELVEPPYGGFCMENMDSTAGWIATATDLLKFMQALSYDRLSWNRIFNENTFGLMVAPPEYLHGSNWYGMGLLVKDQGRSWWHTGSLEGSTAVVTHEDEGFTWAALVNYQLNPNDLNDFIQYAIRGVPQWHASHNTSALDSKGYPLVADSVTANGRDLVKIMIPEHKFRHIFSMIATKGYRLTWIDAFDVFGTIHFNTIWAKNDGRKWKAYVGITSSKYRRVYKSKTNRGYRLSHIETYVSRRRLRYAAIFVRDHWPAWITYHGYSPHRHRTEFYRLLKEGYRLVVQSVTEYRGRLFISAIYDKVYVGAFKVRLGLNIQQYREQLQAQLRRGRILSYVQVYEHQGILKYSAIFSPVTSSVWATGQDMTKYTMLNRLHEYGEVNVPLRCVTAHHDGDMVKFAALWK